MISSRTNDAKEKIILKDPNFRPHLCFYQSRHWWPTQHLIKTFGERLLTESMEVLYLATAQAITAQMGHEDIETTYKYYIDMARIIMMLHKGQTFELINNPNQTIGAFMQALDIPDDILEHEAAGSVEDDEEVQGEA